MTHPAITAVNRALAELANFAADLPAIQHRLECMQAGYPAKASGRGNTSTGFDLNDPQPGPRKPSPDDDVPMTPVEAAAHRAERGDEPATLELALLETGALRLAANAKSLLGAFDRYRTPEEKDPKRLGQEPADWCASCYRNELKHTSIYRRPRGSVVYPERYKTDSPHRGPDGEPLHKAGDPIPGRGLCKWCGEFLTARGYFPPLPVLRARHSGSTGSRVSPTLIAKHEASAKAHRKDGPLANRTFTPAPKGRA
jgi:hypothetical protein